MMKLFTVILCVLSCSSQDLRTFKTFTFDKQSYTYAVQLPKNFDSSKSYPVLIGPADVSKKEQSFYTKDVKDTEGWILIDYPIYSATSRIPEIKAFLTHLKSSFNVENDKFHVACFSANSA